MKKIVIIGSGLSGMSAAVHLCDAGHQVTILESQRHLGGRTASWEDRGMHIESGLHRFLGFYTALPELINHVGVNLNDILCWEDEIEIRTVQGLHSTLGLAPLHKPLKTLWNAVGHHDLIPPSDRLTLVRMITAGLKDYTSRPLELDNVSVAEYARKHGISETTIEHFLTPLTEGIFFVPVSKYSMYNFIGLFAPYKKSMHKLRVGAFMGGMSDVMIQPMADYVQKYNGKILPQQTAESLIVKDNKVVGVKTRTRSINADYVIVATSLFGAKQIIQSSLPEHPHFTQLMNLPTMPSVTFQVELDRPSMNFDRTTFGPLTIMASFAEQSRTTFSDSRGRLSIILSNPEKYLSVDPGEIMTIVQHDAKMLGIKIDNENIMNFRKVNLPDDFYSLAVGNEVLRPAQKTEVPGLTLAGDYTKQKYLATMEGAVVSGKIAADDILQSIKS
jgi:15-cis-phytoene desaturase